MAELEQKQSGGKKGKKGRKKMSTRIDLTPMVDLGFLLVTFFMLTTTFSKPQTMEINLPVKPKEEIKEEDYNALKASRAFNVLLGKDNKIYWYIGLPNEPIEGPHTTDFSAGGIRKILLENNSSIKDMVVLIKPTNDAVYRNVVDILDEMNITDIKRYALVDASSQDLDLIKTIK